VVRNPNTPIFNGLFFQFLVGFGVGRGIESAKGMVSSARVGAEGRERVVGTREEGESALKLKGRIGRKSMKAVRGSCEGKRG